MIKKFILTFIGLCFSFPAQAEGKAPIVLELFTSQSCSSCPPADRLLGELAKSNEDIIALSCHVTYWNYLHWEDTLSNQFCNIRQRDYVRQLKSRGPYTPQIVINGQDTMVGSQGEKIKRAINHLNPIKNIDLTLTEKTLHIRLPETPGTDSYAINLVIYGQDHTQHIPSGENKGRNVTYSNPVQDIISLGTWDGTGKKITYDVSDKKSAKGYAVLAQKNGKTGEIIAAGKIEK